MASSWQPGDLVATRARTAERTGVCVLCRRVILPGRERVCDRADGQGVVHVACASRLGGTTG